MRLILASLNVTLLIWGPSRVTQNPLQPSRQHRLQALSSLPPLSLKTLIGADQARREAERPWERGFPYLLFSLYLLLQSLQNLSESPEYPSQPTRRGTRFSHVTSLGTQLQWSHGEGHISNFLLADM